MLLLLHIRCLLLLLLPVAHEALQLLLPDLCDALLVPTLLLLRVHRRAGQLLLLWLPPVPLLLP